MSDKNWLRLELDNGWQAIFPENDTEPHAKTVLIYPDGTKEATVDQFDCPCKPSVDFRYKIVVHNSFDGREHKEEGHDKTRCRSCA